MSQARGARRQTQQVFELGQAGRKTGVTLRDNGQRDEHGLQPLDGLFSSPSKPDGSTPRADRSMGEEDMEIDDASSPGPSTVICNRRSGSAAFAIARSPVRTSLGSPAVKNPRLSARMSPQAHTTSLFSDSSPTVPVPPTIANKSTANGKPITVTRNLFAAPKPTLVAQRSGPAKANDKTNKKNVLNAFMSDSDDDENDDDILQPQADVDIIDESMQMIQEFIPPSDAPQSPNNDQDEDTEPIRRTGHASKIAARRDAAAKAEPATANKRQRNPDPEPEDYNSGSDSEISNTPVRLPSPKMPRTSKASTAAAASSLPIKKSSSQTPALPSKSRLRAKPSPAQTQTRRARAPPGKQQNKKVTTASSTATSNTRAAKSNNRNKNNDKDSDDDDDDEQQDHVDKSMLAVHRGPPPPKRRGLMSVHANPNTILTTRSGRSSYRPLEYWRGERVEIDEEAVQDVSGKGAFIVPKVKDIVRVQDLDDGPVRKRRRAKPKTAAASRQRTAASAGADGAAAGASPPPAAAIAAAAAPIPAEPQERWEKDPGVIEGDVVLWTYDHEKYPPGPDDEVGIVTEQLALSSAAVETREIKDATFRYAKTMSLGFMGSGVVDLPAGSEKRPKNSRRMQLVFFVAYGKVKVTIHDNEFRIGAGGQFFVPRGNYYSIANDYDAPARIFFAQACEVEMQEDEGEGDEAPVGE